MTDILIIAVLIVGGMAAILAEMCTPSFGVLAATALACFGYAVYRGFQIGPIGGIGLIVGLLVGLPIYIAFLVRHFPNTALGRRLTLGNAPPADQAASQDQFDPAALLGQTGEALTVLRPSGTVRIGPRKLAARAESGFIAAGTSVKVVSATAFEVVVRPSPATGGQG